MFLNYKTNKRYLNQYYLSVIGLLATANGMLCFFQTPDWELLLFFAPAFVLLSMPSIYLVIIAWFYAILICALHLDFDVVYLAGIPLAIIVTFPASALLHSASHSSIRPRWLRRILGELVGLWQLTGLPFWTIVHVLHHKHTDDQNLDPHPPMDKSYWKFLTDMRQSVSTVLANYYFSLWGKTEESVRNLKEFGIEFKTATFLQVVFWYLLLGPQIFSYFFASAVVFKMLHYAWFNYATHVYTGSETSIVNLDHGFYKLINFLSFGFYYHKNHHLQPNLFDPSKMHKQHKESPICPTINT